MPAEPASLPVIAWNGEPRVSHVDLAERLGITRHRKVRDLINRFRDELEDYGTVAQRRAPVLGGNGATQFVDEFLLVEPQALLICLYSQSPRARQVRKLVIDTFLTLRRGLDAITEVARPALPSVTDAKVRHRKHSFALAWAALLEIGIDPAAFDHVKVRAYAQSFLAAKDAF